jgi:hypothetical protein
VSSFTHNVRPNMPIHSILSTAPQINISQKALVTLSEDDNVMPKHVGDSIHKNSIIGVFVGFSRIY